MEVGSSLHPTAAVLKAFVQGKIDADATKAVRTHLDGCLKCREALAGLTNYSQGATRAPGNTLNGAGANAPPPLGPTTLFNLPPELADHPEYEVQRELGRGGMGVVYLAKHRLSGRIEVLKVMSKALIGQADSRERFLREIQSAARLDHKNVVKMYNAQERGELMVLVMEYVPGEDLSQVVKARGALPVLNACYYIQQAASGLQHAYEKGMIHRDIKPQNLILAREGKKHIVKILDFGLAKATRGDNVEPTLTNTGAMMGTPAYLAPEQSLDAAKVDIRADIYSLGCTLYHLLAGNPPFSGRSVYEIVHAHHSTEAKPLNSIRPEVPADLAVVVRKMMAKDAAQRYQTPIEVVRALDPFVKGTLKPLPPQATRPQASQRSSERPLPSTKPLAPTVTNAIGMKFVWCPPGTFQMGSPPSEERRNDNETQHKVTLTRGFYLGVHEVTQAQWRGVMGSNPSNFKGDNLPVESVSWEECQDFCTKLAQQDGKRFRLPTEAEWEYACRAGSTTPFSFGETISTDKANYDGNYTYSRSKKGIYRRRTTPVGSFPANVWGLFDMHGNVWEWCQDWYGPYPQGDIKDPQSSNNGEARVLRGGSWCSNPSECRAAYRRWIAPGDRFEGLGCRVVLCLD